MECIYDATRPDLGKDTKAKARKQEAQRIVREAEQMELFRSFIEEIYQQNENFHGEVADMEQVKRYYAIKARLQAIAAKCPALQEVDGYDPNPRERHATIWADFTPGKGISAADAAELAGTITMADEIVVTYKEEKGTARLVFHVNDVWKS